MLRTTPFHRENYSRLILTVIGKFYQRCSDRFQALIAVGAPALLQTDARVALAANGGAAAGEGEVERLRAENAKLKQLNNLILHAAYSSAGPLGAGAGEAQQHGAVDASDVVLVRIGPLVAPRGLVKAIEESIREPIGQAYDAQLAHGAFSTSSAHGRC